MNRNFAIAALTFFLAYFVSFNYELALDGAEVTYFGAPFPWNSSSPTSSLIKEVYFVHAAINFFVFAFLSSRILRFGDRFGRVASSILNRASLLLGAIAFILFAMTFTVNDTSLSLWPDALPNKIVAVRVGVGA